MTIRLENPGGQTFYYRALGETDWVTLLKGETLFPAGSRYEVSEDAFNVLGMIISLAVGEGGIYTKLNDPILLGDRQRVGFLVYGKGY